MKINLSIIALAAFLPAAGTALAADSSPLDDITGAAKKLAAADNYSWKTTVEASGGRFRPGPTEGNIEKSGLKHLKATFGENTVEGFAQEGKGCVKTEDGWMSLADATQDDGGGFNPSRMFATQLKNLRPPAAEAEALASKAKDLKLADGVYSGAMTEADVKVRLTFGRPGGGDGPEVSNPKGSVKFWITNGTLVKFQFNVKGHVEFNGNGRDVDRTTTVEIKDVGKTKIEVPDDAKKKMS